MGTHADLVFTGGAVYTADPAQRRVVPAGTGAAGTGPPANAVAVRGDRILAVGAVGDADMTDLVGPRTKVVDLRGRALLPGFQDAHAQFGDLLRSGARLAAGSDWAVSSANPLRAIHVAVNRTLPGNGGAEPLLPGQRLGLAEALAAYTIGSAYVNHLDGQTGAIEAGRLADLIVLDRDPFGGPSSEIASASVERTYVAGEQVYAAAR